MLYDVDKWGKPEWSWHSGLYIAPLISGSSPLWNLHQDRPNRWWHPQQVQVHPATLVDSPQYYWKVTPGLLAQEVAVGTASSDRHTWRRASRCCSCCWRLHWLCWMSSSIDGVPWAGVRDAVGASGGCGRGGIAVVCSSSGACCLQMTSRKEMGTVSPGPVPGCPQ